MVGLVVTALVLRGLTPVRALRRAGSSPLTGLFTVRGCAETRAYRELSERESASLVWWGLHIATGVLLVEWSVLIAVAS
ncbi:MAG TPA: hypothetical protein DEF51_32370 [Myxococcales bacterium]|nr:hypothetical protein [Myxococcales bacterium]